MIFDWLTCKQFLLIDKKKNEVVYIHNYRRKAHAGDRILLSIPANVEQPTVQSEVWPITISPIQIP